MMLMPFKPEPFLLGPVAECNLPQSTDPGCQTASQTSAQVDARFCRGAFGPASGEAKPQLWLKILERSCGWRPLLDFKVGPHWSQCNALLAGS